MSLCCCSAASRRLLLPRPFLGQHHHVGRSLLHLLTTTAAAATTTSSSTTTTSLSPPQQRQVALYVDALLGWNQRMNLTAVTDEAEVMTRHVADSLASLPPLERAFHLRRRRHGWDQPYRRPFRGRAPRSDPCRCAAKLEIYSIGVYAKAGHVLGACH